MTSDEVSVAVASMQVRSTGGGTDCWTSLEYVYLSYLFHLIRPLPINLTFSYSVSTCTDYGSPSTKLDAGTCQVIISPQR